MKITLIDDSIPFDSYTPGAQPMGGAEKAVCGLAPALARLGHEVTVINRVKYPVYIEGVRWEPLGDQRPAETDALIAYRKPALLSAVRQAKKRLLWLTQPARILKSAAAREQLDSHRPILVFQGKTHHRGFDGFKDLRCVAVPPAIRGDYLSDEACVPAKPPRAIVTTHPLHGLDWLLTLWLDKIRPRCPDAELHIFSISLQRALLGGEMPEELKPLIERIKPARDHGVAVRYPKGDPGMADEYRLARAHLYPGHEDDMACYTLTETQAVGVPAVARPLGAAAERIDNGTTGFIAPDDEAFANVTVELLTQDDMFWSLNRDARLNRRTPDWERAAKAFEGLLA